MHRGLTAALGLEAAEVCYRGGIFRNGMIYSRAVALRHMSCNGHGMQTNRGGWAQIGQVKEKISSEKGWEASQQKLIYSGMHPDLLFRQRPRRVVLIMCNANRQDLARCKYGRVIQHRRKRFHRLHDIKGARCNKVWACEQKLIVS